MFANKNVGDAVNEGISEHKPIILSKIPLFISKDDNIDVSLYVSPSDSAGLCIGSSGVSVDIASPIAGSTLLVAATKENMPRTTSI